MGAIMRPALARRLGLLLSSAAIVLGGAVTAQAATPVQQEDVSIQDVYGSGTIDPCNGEPIAWTGNVHVMAGMTTDAAGGFVIHGVVNFNDVKGVDPTGNQYTIQLNSAQAEVWAPSSPNLGDVANVYTHTLSLHVISQNGTGNYYDYGVAHFTITPDGQIVVAFVHESFGCSA